MEYPAAVKAAAAKADALQKQLAEGKPADQQAGTTPPNTDGTPAPTQADTLPKPVEQTLKQSDTQDFKDKFFTLKGKYDAEVPRLHQEIKNLTATVSQLQEQLQTANTKQSEDHAEDGKSIDPNKEAMMKEAFLDMGDEFSTLVEVIQSLKQQNADLKNELTRLSGDVQTEKEAKVQERYSAYRGRVEQEVARMGADFEKLNTDRNFLNWLRQYPDGETESRLAKLRRAESQMDMSSTVAIFRAYLGRQQPQAKAGPSQPNLQPPATNTWSDQAPPSASTRTWTRADIAQFYKDKAQGKFRGRDEEMNAIEADIFAAQTTGRIAAR